MKIKNIIIEVLKREKERGKNRECLTDNLYIKCSLMLGKSKGLFVTKFESEIPEILQSESLK